MRIDCSAWRGLAALSSIAWAFGAGASADPLQTLKSTLHQRYPQLKIEDVRPAPVAGLYEVFTGNQLVYSDGAGDHLFVGKLIDTKTQQDLAEKQLEARLAIDFDKLPFDRAIKIVKGSGARRLAIFEDPDCPYCQQLEKELANVNDVTLYVFLFPLTEVHPGARAHARVIWCSSDRASTWTHWMLERKPPAPSSCTEDPIDQLQALGTALNIMATPTLFLANGERYQGVVPAATLEELLTAPLGNAAVANKGSRASRERTDGGAAKLHMSNDPHS
jgi:thiol:disulfide interchange protein DsbC